MNTLSKVFLVALRLVVGWHFLYEGVWKVDSQARDGQANVATRYGLEQSTGRLRDYFSRVPPGGLNPEVAAARVDQWQDEVGRVFQATNRPMTEEQKARLGELCDKVKLATAEPLQQGDESAIDSVVKFDWMDLHEEVLKVAAPEESQRFSSLDYLQSSDGPFRGLFRGLVPDIDGLDRLTRESVRARIDRRYDQIVAHYQSAGVPLTGEQRARLSVVRENLKQSISATLADPLFRGRIELYKAMRDRAREDSRRAVTPFARERLAADRKNVDVAGRELVAFVNEPMAELAVQAQVLATAGQLRAGPVPGEPAPAAFLDWMVEWGLTAIGLCLLVGLFTPAASVAAAGMLLMFYVATPPLPGLAAASLGGHYLYVDRNLIELVAALVIAATGTGRWAGLDFYLHEFVIPRLRRVRKSADLEQTPTYA